MKNTMLIEVGIDIDQIIDELDPHDYVKRIDPSVILEYIDPQDALDHAIHNMPVDDILTCFSQEQLEDFLLHNFEMSFVNEISNKE